MALTLFIFFHPFLLFFFIDAYTIKIITFSSVINKKQNRSGCDDRKARKLNVLFSIIIETIAIMCSIVQSALFISSNLKMCTSNTLNPFNWIWIAEKGRFGGCAFNVCVCVSEQNEINGIVTLQCTSDRKLYASNEKMKRKCCFCLLCFAFDNQNTQQKRSSFLHGGLPKKINLSVILMRNYTKYTTYLPKSILLQPINDAIMEARAQQQ